MISRYLKSLFLCSLFIMNNFIQATSINEIITTFPLEDYTDLEQVFYRLINENNFGYTLFGDKPVSIGSYFKLTPWENFIELGQRNEIFWKKWKIWEKYKNKFQIKNYLLIKESSNVTNEIILINKKAFINMLIKHQNIFEKVLNKKINPVHFLMQIEEGKLSFYDSIQNNIMLLGICLGYGKHNAMLFNERNQYKLNKRGLENSRINLEAFGDYDSSPLLIPSIHFIADLKHPETKILEKKYKELRGKISTIYTQGNFLEITLSQLTAD
jgi:hypothetical protein